MRGELKRDILTSWPHGVRMIIVGRFPAFLWGTCLLACAFVMFVATLAGSWPAAFIGPLCLLGSFYMGKRLQMYQNHKWEDEWNRKSE